MHVAATAMNRMLATTVVLVIALGTVAATAPAQAPPPRDAGGQGLLLDCPIQQPAVRNGARPDPEVLKKVIRCAKGEKAVAPGDEGAVQVEVSTTQIGASRPWSYTQDQGNGKVGTVVYPVRASYAVRTFYRTATEHSEGWVRVLNFYVNAFGEWQIGSEEPVRSPTRRRVNKD